MNDDDILFTHKMMMMANANRIRSSTKSITSSVCLPIHLIRPSRAKHSIVTNIAPKNNNVTHSTFCKTESSWQLQTNHIFSELFGDEKKKILTLL